MKITPRRGSGFTLIEIMIVVIILAVLAAIVVPKFMGAPERARVTRAKVDIRNIESALNLYKLDNYTYPTTEQGLKALVHKPSTQPVPPNWHQYLDSVPQDPWGKPYKYLYPGIHGDAFDVWTDGPPGAKSGQVIGNWNIGNQGSGNGNSGNSGTGNG